MSLRPSSLILLLFFLAACGPEERPRVPIPKTAKEPFVALDSIPSFSADSAYAFVEKQVAFGPRVPNTPEHIRCAEWLASELERHGLETEVQSAQVRAFNDEVLNIRNIIGRWNPEAKERVILYAHWDTRPFADRDDERRTKPIDGANDGASGVGVILELMRSIQAYSKKPEVGIDVVFFDAEDYGKPSSSMTGQGNDSWCLGSQHWAAGDAFSDSKPKYGILLDMVGAEDAVFPKEYASRQFAQSLQDRIWTLANNLGYSAYFINEISGGITDDHIYVSRLADIPSIDIIHYEPWKRDFGKFHHTHEDNMDIISKETLGAVGHVLVEFLYRE